jgi:hypothetical protein
MPISQTSTQELTASIPPMKPTFRHSPHTNRQSRAYAGLARTVSDQGHHRVRETTAACFVLVGGSASGFNRLRVRDMNFSTRAKTFRHSLGLFRQLTLTTAPFHPSANPLQEYREQAQRKLLPQVRNLLAPPKLPMLTPRTEAPRRELFA